MHDAEIREIIGDIISVLGSIDLSLKVISGRTTQLLAIREDEKNE